MWMALYPHVNLKQYSPNHWTRAAGGRGREDILLETFKYNKRVELWSPTKATITNHPSKSPNKSEIVSQGILYPSRRWLTGCRVGVHL